MKPFLALAAAALVGAAITGLILTLFYTREVRTTARSLLATAELDKEYSCSLSLMVLGRLEAGETERAKSILAQEVASFYSYPWQTNRPQRQKFLDLVEITKPKSSVLREELTKSAQ